MRVRRGGKNAEDTDGSYGAPCDGGLSADGRNQSGGDRGPVTGSETRDQIVIVENGVIRAV
jgi:hypothetical protein